MAKFLFVYRTSAEQKAASPSPEQMQVILAAWNQWAEKVAKGGNMIDRGDGLHPTGKVVKPGGIVTDGPFIESKDIVGGYSILQADSYEKVAEFAKTCPVLTRGGTVEIRELAGFN